mgnify:FL=1
MSNLYKNFFHSQISEHQLIIEKLKKNNEDDFIRVLEIWYHAIKKNKKIIFFGNGGSASDAQHLSTELTVRFSKNRKSIPALSLVTDTSTISAIGNDFGFDYLFERQLEAIGQKGDVVVGITTSGKSKNVINALKYAKKNNMNSIVFTGRNIKLIESIADGIISISAINTSRIQEAHILIGQILCNALEKKLGLASFVKEQTK